MASASESQAGASAMPTPCDVRSWGVSEVAEWALAIRSISSIHVNILIKNEITGEDLLDRVTEEKLVVLYKMPGGPAGRIMSALAAINTAEKAVSSSMGESTGTSRAFMCAVFTEGTLVSARLRLYSALCTVFAAPISCSLWAHSRRRCSCIRYGRCRNL